MTSIFERFHRGRGASSGSGTGLGLAIAKALMQAQNGGISVESQVAVGSTFTVSLLKAAREGALPRPR